MYRNRGAAGFGTGQHDIGAGLGRSGDSPGHSNLDDHPRRDVAHRWPVGTTKARGAEQRVDLAGLRLCVTQGPWRMFHGREEQQRSSTVMGAPSRSEEALERSTFGRPQRPSRPHDDAVAAVKEEAWRDADS